MFIQFVFVLMSVCQPWPLSCLSSHPLSLPPLPGPPTLCLSQLSLLCLVLPPPAGLEQNGRSSRPGGQLPRCQSKVLLPAAELGPAALQPEGGAGVQTGGREGGRRHSSCESLSPGWRAAEAPDWSARADSGALSRAGMAAPPLSTVSRGLHFWGEDDLEIFGARSPSLQKRGPQGLSGHCAGGNTELEGGGRSLCTGPVPHVLPVSFQLPSLRHSQPQQPQARDSPHLARCLLT